MRSLPIFGIHDQLDVLALVQRHPNMIKEFVTVVMVQWLFQSAMQLACMQR